MIPLVRVFIRRCKQRKREFKISDSAVGKLKGADVLIRALILRRLLKQHVLARDEQLVGVLLPASIGGCLANMALALDRRVAVNLNYTMPSDVLNGCLRQADIRHVVTSRKLMERINVQLEADIVYLEDLRAKPTKIDKMVAALQTYVVPGRLLERGLGLHHIAGDDLLTVIFTSGSTGRPKGVMLTQSNVAHNVAAIDQVVHLHSTDVLLGIVPFFHALGYTVTLWGVAALDIKGAYHFSPLEARQVGELCRQYRATLLLATPTFLHSYLRRLDKEDLATLDVVVAGAEKLSSELATAFEDKFGVRPAEGYGTTELAPLVAVNVPRSRSRNNSRVEAKEGTVGRCLPGVSARVNDLDSGKQLSAGEAGMLWIKGPNVMKGYLHEPDKTAEVIQDGWYKTGDLAILDDDGFITITGRVNRFSKIGGEMVPHGTIEDTLNRLVSAGEEAMIKAAITAIPDQKKGERLIVVHTPLDRTPAELCKSLQEAGLPNLFIPSPDSFTQVDHLPLLGTGKLDLNDIKQIALSRFPESH